MPLPSSARIWLVLSLALNLFMAGAIASYLFVGRDHGHHRGAPWRGHSLHPRVLRKLLPEQDQPVLDAILQAHRPRIRERVKALRDARGAVAQAMRAEPFERRQLEAALTGLRSRETEMAEAAQAMALELAARVSPEGRARLAEQMKPRKFRRRGGPDEHPPPGD